VIRLPEVLTIGFTGHRHVDDEAMCRAALHSLLTQQQAIPDRALHAVSSVAAGTDLLFAETCIELAIPLQVLLPLPQNEFCKDFDAAAWQRAEQVMSASLSVEIIGGDEPRPDCYYTCGLETVQRSQLLVTVWNGKPAQGAGGTAEIVDFARQMGRAVLWIHSETGALQKIAETSSDKASHEGELRFFNSLPPCGSAVADDSPTALAHAWLAKLDANAVKVAPQVRRLAAVPIVCTALAAVISGSAPHMRASAVWVTVGAALGLMAALLPAALRLSKRQALWVRLRTAAEVTRSVLALWDTPVRYQVVGQEVLPELDGMVRSLNLLKTRARLGSSVDAAAFKPKYLEERVRDQMNYFSRQATKSAAQARKYRLISKLSTAGAILLSAWSIGSRFIPGAGSRGPWLGLLTSVLFQLATIAAALLIVHDCDRRQTRYLELHTSLAALEVELRAYRTWPPVVQAASKIERALLVELLEWRSLLQNRKMPRS
jgi:hypothetical protein